MVFTAKSPKINIEEVRSLSKLEGQALANKQQRAISQRKNPICQQMLIWQRLAGMNYAHVAQVRSLKIATAVVKKD